jgi:hypothetical protein
MEHFKSENKSIVTVPAYGVISKDPKLSSIEDVKKLLS